MYSGDIWVILKLPPKLKNHMNVKSQRIKLVSGDKMNAYLPTYVMLYILYKTKNFTSVPLLIILRKNIFSETILRYTRNHGFIVQLFGGASEQR